MVVLPSICAPIDWNVGNTPDMEKRSVNEFVFCYNSRFCRHVSFETLLGLAAHHEPTSYWDIIKRDNPRKGAEPPRLPHIDEP